MKTTLLAPAKLNLFLAVTGQRADGFHDLVSVVAPLSLADTLEVEGAAGAGARFTLTCNDPEVPVDESNLVLRAAQAFAQATGWTGRAVFQLEKRIPMGAGMGGGSSDGVAALRALNELAGTRLKPAELAPMAASLGSDCPLFLQDGPVIVRGRGEQIEPMTGAVAARLRGRPVLVFKPAFGVPTAWAYRRMAEDAAAGAKDVYLPAAVAERRLAGWMADDRAGLESLLFNNLERPAFAKYLALPTLLDQLRREFGLEPRMTGSGSACFAFLPDGAPVAEVTQVIRAAWGESSYIVASQIA